MFAMKAATQKISRVTAKPGGKGAPSSRERQAPYVLLDRHAASRLAMTERPLSSEASDRALLGSYFRRDKPISP